MTEERGALALGSFLLSVLALGLLTPMGAPAAYGLGLLTALAVSLVSHIVAGRIGRKNRSP